MKENNFEKTKKLARITQKLCRIMIIATAVGVGLLLLCVLVAYVVPPEHIKPLKDSGSLSFDIGGFNFIPAEAFDTVEGMRNFLVSVLGTVVAGSALFMVCALRLVGILKSVEQGAPFAKDNTRRLRAIGSSLIVGAFVVPIVSNIPKLIVYNLHQYENMRAFNNVDITLLLCGLLVFVLSGIFAYGAYLQRDHDQTV